MSSGAQDRLHRALRVLAGSPLGCTETIMLAHGSAVDFAPLGAGGRIKVTWDLTDIGRMRGDELRSSGSRLPGNVCRSQPVEPEPGGVGVGPE